MAHGYLQISVCLRWAEGPRVALLFFLYPGRVHPVSKLTSVNKQAITSLRLFICVHIFA
jgi:hypothetical protein